MRNLIAFINRYSFFFLFLVFEVLAFYLLFRNNHFQRASFLNSTNKLSGAVYTKYSSLNDYFHLKEVNESLSAENERLRNESLRSYQRLFGENIIVRDTIFKKKYHYTKAKVVNNSTHKQRNYLTLNIGRLNGIESGMGVVGSSGIVGVVKNVSDHYASVVSVLHRDSKISSKLKGTRDFGSLQWNGEDYRTAKLVDIPKHVDITQGDTVITSGYSSTFPDGIAVATVIDFEKPEGENFYDINVKLINDFRKITYVYVIKNNTALEQKQLELETLEEDD